MRANPTQLCGHTRPENAFAALNVLNWATVCFIANEFNFICKRNCVIFYSTQQSDFIFFNLSGGRCVNFGAEYSNHPKIPVYVTCVIAECNSSACLHCSSQISRSIIHLIQYINVFEMCHCSFKTPTAR